MQISGYNIYCRFLCRLKFAGGVRMILDMGPMLRGEVDTIPVDYMLRPEPLQGIEFTADAHVVGKVTDTGGYMRLVLEADMPYKTICARCLDDVTGVYTVCFERTVAEERSLTQEQIDDNVDEYIIVRDGKLVRVTDSAIFCHALYDTAEMTVAFVIGNSIIKFNASTGTRIIFCINIMPASITCCCSIRFIIHRFNKTIIANSLDITTR